MFKLIFGLLTVQDGSAAARAATTGAKTISPAALPSCAKFAMKSDALQE
ncbi:MAG: hypothetical protein JOY71_12960 [Acetobacteraceae bacterium]|nr:hypothetical protein [Acetobacteraceae bacterium]